MKCSSGWILVLLALATACARSATAQVIKARGCHEPRIAIGVMEASGTVRFQVTRDGKTASGSVAAVMANGASLAGLQSAAERQLGACRFDTRKIESSFPVTVEVQIKFDSLQAWFSDPRITLDQRAPEPVAVDSAPGAGPFPATLYLVDERPREQNCKVAMMPQRFPTGHSVQDFLQTAQLTQGYESGWGVVRFVVKEDGRADARSIEVLRTSSSHVGEKMAKSIARCRFAPGRVGGVPVSVVTTEVLWIR
ncbi:MAG TPA: hypothetical protein VF151_11060 [Gemmatimonadales bacterium]